MVEKVPATLSHHRIHTIEAVSHVAPSSHSHPFDTALRPYSGQAVALQEATSESGIRVADYCLVINQWQLLLWPRGDRQRSEVMLWVT